MPPSQISFDTLCRFFERMVGQRQQRSRGKRTGPSPEGGYRLKEVQLFIDRVVYKPSHDAFSIFRLMLPAVRAGCGCCGQAQGCVGALILLHRGVCLVRRGHRIC